MFRLELVNAGTESGGLENVVETGTLADLGRLLAHLKTIPTGPSNVAYVRVFDVDAGEYLPMHFGAPSDLSDGGVYCG